MCVSDVLCGACVLSTCPSVPTSSSEHGLFRYLYYVTCPPPTPPAPVTIARDVRGHLVMIQDTWTVLFRGIEQSLAL